MYNKFNIMLLFVLTALFTSMHGQAPDTMWTKLYGGIDFDVGEAIHQTPDSGCIIVGSTYSFGAGNSDIWLLKMNSLGDTLWTKTYGGSYQDDGYSLDLTLDGGYIITGIKESLSTGFNVWLLKTNVLGDTLWTKNYGGNTGDDVGQDVRQTADSGYIIVGYTGSYGAGYYDAYLIKTNEAGDSLWTRIYGGSGSDDANAVDLTTDGGYIITGSTDSFGAGNSDIWLLKTNAQGDTLWTKTYGGASLDYGADVKQTVDGGYIVLGVINMFQDIWLLKTDSQGDTTWTKSISSGYYNEAYSVEQTVDYGYIIAGYTGTAALYADGYIIKTDAAGNIKWTMALGGSESDFLRSVELTLDGGYIASGYTYSYGMGDADLWLVKTEPDTLGIVDKEKKYFPEFNLEIYPDPVKRGGNIKYILPQSNHVSIGVHDITGRRVKEIINENQIAGVHNVQFIMTNLPQGVYFVKLNIGNYSDIGKFVLVK